MSGAAVNTVRPLTLSDSDAIARLSQIEAVSPMVLGNAPVEHSKLTRRTNIYGVVPAMTKVWTMTTSLGNFLPEDNTRNARPFAVLGATVRNELFGTSNPLGEKVRIDGSSFRVVGVMESKGNMMGVDLDDAVYIPVSWAKTMFNREGLMSIDLAYTPTASVDRISERIQSLLLQRHGAEDFTVKSQDEMISTLDSILSVLTLAVGGLGGISLLVGAIGILTIMTIAVTERTNEVGLLRALGGGRGQILALFLGEAIVLAALGGLGGLIIGAGGAWLVGVAIPSLPTHTPWSFVLIAEIVAASIGLAAGVAPAWKAANLDPIEALRTE
jgi:putative ABC transport system permease protein